MATIEWERDHRRWRHGGCLRLVPGQAGHRVANQAGRTLGRDPDPNPAVAMRALEAMMTMQWLYVAAIEAARRG